MRPPRLRLSPIHFPAGGYYDLGVGTQAFAANEMWFVFLARGRVATPSAVRRLLGQEMTVSPFSGVALTHRNLGTARLRLSCTRASGDLVYEADNMMTTEWAWVAIVVDCSTDSVWGSGESVLMLRAPYKGVGQGPLQRVSLTTTTKGSGNIVPGSGRNLALGALQAGVAISSQDFDGDIAFCAFGYGVPRELDFREFGIRPRKLPGVQFYGIPGKNGRDVVYDESGTGWHGTAFAGSNLTPTPADVRISGGRPPRRGVSLVFPVEVPPTSVGITGAGAVTLPMLTASGAGTVAVQGAAAVTLPALTASGTGTVAVQGAAAVTVPMLTASGAATVAVQAAAAVSLPMLSAAGAASVAVKADAAVSVPMLTASGAGAVRVLGDGAVTVPMLTAGGAASTGTQADGAVVLPMLVAGGDASVSVTASGAVALPMLTVQGAAAAIVRGDGVVTLPMIVAVGDATVSGGVVLPIVRLVARISIRPRLGGEPTIAPRLGGTVRITPV